MTANEFYIAVEFYLDGEYETTMYYTDFDSLVRNMDIMFHTDDFDDVQDVIDFLNDQDADDIQHHFDIPINTMDWEFKAEA